MERKRGIQTVTGGVDRVTDRVQTAKSKTPTGRQVSRLNIFERRRLKRDEEAGRVITAEIPRLKEKKVPARAYITEDTGRKDRQTGRPITRVVGVQDLPGYYGTEKVKGRRKRTVVTSRIEKGHVPNGVIEGLRRNGIVPAFISKIRSGSSPETREAQGAFREIEQEARRLRQNPGDSRGVDPAEAALIQKAGPDLASRALAAQSRRRIRQYYNQTVAEALRDSVRAERVLADLENNPVKTAEPGVVRSVARNVTAFVFGQSGGTDESVEYHPAIGLITRAPQRDRAEYRFPPEKVRADIVSATVNPPKIVDWYNRLRIGLLGKEPVKSRFGEVLVVETGSGEVLASSFSMNAARDVAAINAAGEANRILAMAQRDGIEEHTYEQMGLDPVGELGKSRGFRRRVAGTPQRRTVGRDLPDRVE